MVITCMDVDSSVLLSKTMQLDGYTPAAQMWLDGYDRNILKNDAQYMKNTYFMLQHVPYELATAYPAVFPGMSLYFQSMAKYGYSSNEFSDVALQGWEGANTFVEGLRAAGKHPTQASVVAAINKIKSRHGRWHRRPDQLDDRAQQGDLPIVRLVRRDERDVDIVSVVRPGVQQGERPVGLLPPRKQQT